MGSAGAKRWWRRFLLATSLLTRVPLAAVAQSGSQDLGHSLGLAPLVGILLGLAGGAVFWLASSLGLPPLAAGLLTVLATFLLTGGLHEDGLADVADGFGGGQDQKRKLAIMRDSRIGSYGSAALIFSVALRAAALSAVADPTAVCLALIAAHSVSRGLLPAIMYSLPLARPDGLAATVGQAPGQAVILAIGTAVIAAVSSLGVALGAAALMIGAIATLFVSWLARRQIGGYTGDVLGAAQQGSEAAILIAAASLL